MKDTDRSSWQQPTSPEIVLENLKNAIRERNVENYIRSLVDTLKSQRRFVFVPDPEVLKNNPAVFENWSLEKEREYVTRLLASLPSDSVIQLTFMDVTQPVISDSSIFDEKYVFIVNHTLQNIPRRTSGRAIFYLEENTDGNWSIYRWEDIRMENQPTWSEIKASF